MDKALVTLCSALVNNTLPKEKNVNSFSGSWLRIYTLSLWRPKSPLTEYDQFKTANVQSFSFRTWSIFLFPFCTLLCWKFPWLKMFEKQVDWTTNRLLVRTTFACVLRRGTDLSSRKRRLGRTEIYQRTDHRKRRTLPFTRTFRGCRLSARQRNVLHLDILYVSHFLYVSHLLVGFSGCKCKQKMHKSMFGLFHFSVICILIGLLSPPVGGSAQRRSSWFTLLEEFLPPMLLFRGFSLVMVSFSQLK